MTQTGNSNISISNKADDLTFAQLLNLAENELITTIKRCALLPMYKTKWALHGFDIKRNFRLPDLKSAPLITREDLVAESSNISHKSYTGKYIHQWIKSIDQEKLSGYWMPRGVDDVMDLSHHAGRIADMLALDNNDCVLFLNQPVFGAANLLPHSLIQWLNAKGISCQFITLDMDLMEHVTQWITVLTQNQPTVMIAQSSDAKKLSVMLTQLNNASASNIRAEGYEGSKILPALRLMLLYGHDSIGEQKEVESIYNTETLLSIGLADDGIDALECRAHNGVHLWIDKGLYEIIPDGCDFSPDIPPALPWLWETKAGTCGELVVTTFNEILPLIRYRSGYRVEYAGNDVCFCGYAHPRVKLK